jgi:cation/acetate symporter
VLASASAIAHDLYVNVIKDGNASQAQQMKAARIASIGVGIVAIFIGILAKGQNVAHLVGMAFAVAASSNLPAIFLTLYWKKCNTSGVVMGMLIGAGSAILLVLVSPNMTYPLKVLNEANAIIATAPADLSSADASTLKSIAKAKEDIAKFSGQTTSIMGLEKPLFRLKNPGIISIPLGFLMVVLFSLLTRDKRSEDLWEELYVRQNTGLHVEDVSH